MAVEERDIKIAAITGVVIAIAVLVIRIASKRI